MRSTALNRRACLKTLTIGTAALAAPHLLAAQHRRVERVGLQLFTVRDQMAKGVPATLAAVAAAGYREVETAGTGDLTAVQFAQALKDAGLTAPAAHVPINVLQEQPEELLNTAQIIGYRYLVVPWLPPEMRTDEGYKLTIDSLNQFGERSAAEGIQTCYHNHDFEFEMAGGARPFDVMLANCDRNLVHFELDLFWAAHAGVDAAAYLRADPRRYPLCHVKDRTADGQMTEVGAGVIDFPALFTAGTGLRHYFVEHDRPADSLASIRTSFKAVQEMSW